MGNIHAAQLDANVHAMERERIERGRGIAMMENFSRRRAEFLEHSSQFRRSIMEDVEGRSPMSCGGILPSCIRRPTRPR